MSILKFKHIHLKKQYYVRLYTTIKIILRISTLNKNALFSQILTILKERIEMDIDNNFEEFPNIEERQKDFNCSIGFTMTVIGSKQRAIILWHILNQEPIRYSQLKKEVVHISHKILSQELKYLERDGLIKRISYSTIPPKVEYTLTSKGKSIVPILQQFANWGATNMQEKNTCGLSCKECRKIK